MNRPGRRPKALGAPRLLFSTRVGAVPLRIEPLEQLGAGAAINDALPDPGKTVRVGDVGKMADQRIAARDTEFAGHLSAQQFAFHRKALRDDAVLALLEPLLKAVPLL